MLVGSKTQGTERGGGLEGSEVVIGGIAWEGQSGGSYPFALVGPTLTYKEAFFFKL